MADLFTKAQRSNIMSKIRANNTKPEMIVRKFLFANGLRYRLHSRNFPGKPDIVLPKYNTVVFVNGCFWHGHSCKTWSLKKQYWKEKIGGNITRDRRNIRAIKKMGWKVIVIWECSVTKKSLSAKSLTNLVKKIKNIE